MFLNQIRCCYRVQRACFNNYRIAINGPGFIAKRWNGRNNNTCCEGTFWNITLLMAGHSINCLCSFARR